MIRKPHISGDGWRAWVLDGYPLWTGESSPGRDDILLGALKTIKTEFPSSLVEEDYVGQYEVTHGTRLGPLYDHVAGFLRKWGYRAFAMDVDRGSGEVDPPRTDSDHLERTSHQDVETRGGAIELRARRRLKKRPRMGAPRSPVAMGAFVGCGTGAGGFKPGNRCGGEDGLPNAPHALGGALRPVGKAPAGKHKAAQAKIDAMKAKAGAKQKAKQNADRKFSIQIKREKAAARKAAKDAANKAAADKAAAAAAKQKQAMLQKIRLKNASKRLVIHDSALRPDQDVYDSAVKEMVDSVKRAKKSPACKGSGVGLCSYIAEDVSGRLSEKFKDRPHIEVVQHLPAGRDHASVVIVDHKSKTAVEVDIPESKYQRRTKTGKFIKIKNPAISSNDVQLKDIDYSEFKRDSRPARLPGEGDLAYHMRANKRDFDEVRDGILADHERIVVGSSKAYDQARIAVQEAQKVRVAAFDAIRKADPSAKYFLKTGPDGRSFIEIPASARLRPGDKEYEDAMSAIKAEDDAVAARVAAEEKMRASENVFRRAAWARIGSLREGGAVNASSSPPAISSSELKEFNSLRTMGGFTKTAPTNTLREPDSQVKADVAAAMEFYSAVGGAHLGKVLQKIRVAQIHSKQTAYASRVVTEDNDYDFDDLSGITTPPQSMVAFTQSIAPSRGAPGAPAENWPYIGLKGLVRRERWERGPDGKAVKVTRNEPAEAADRLQATAVHEIAHPLGQTKSANALVNEFWLRRWDEHGRPPLKLYSSDRDRKHQRTFDDRWFGQNYSGVVYARKSSQNANPSSPTFAADNAGRFRETEVLTMGAQHMFSDPKRFLEHDPEHFFLVVGVLSGRFFRK